MLKTPDIWLGSETSFQRLLINQIAFLNDLPAMLKLEEQAKAKLFVNKGKDEDEDEEDYSFAKIVARENMQKFGNVGVLSVNGPLSTETSFFDYLFGGIGYDAIAAGLQEFLDDDEVDNIILSMATPGGDAEGISELADFIRGTSAIKPVQAWVPSSALSAGYWIAAATDKITMAQLGEVGSIGAISSFTSVARRLKDNGIDVFVQRSGKDKAPLHPAEPISEKGKEKLASVTSHLHKMFIKNVLSERPSLSGVPLEQWAEGDTYFYEDALRLGLADRAPVTIGAIISELSNQSSTSIGDQTMPKQQIVLSESAKAALASGAPLNSLETISQTVEEPAATALSSEPGEGEEQETEEEEETTGVTTLAETGGLATYLEGKISKLESRVETLVSENHDLKAKLTTLSGAAEALMPIVVEATHHMQIPLGQTPTKLDGLSATALSEYYAEIRTAFNERFKAGRTSVEATQQDKPTNPLIERLSLVNGGKA